MIMLRLKNIHICLLSVALITGVLLSTETQAELFDEWTFFENNTNDLDLLTGFTLDVTDPGGGQVLFTFANIYPDTGISPDPVVTHVWLNDDADLLSYPGALPITDPGPGVEFGANGDPMGNFFVADHSYEATPPPTDNGINKTESLGILFDIVGTDFDGIIAAIYEGTDPLTATSPYIQVAMKLQATGENGQGSDGITLVPVPGAVILGLLGLGMAGIKLRKYA